MATWKNFEDIDTWQMCREYCKELESTITREKFNFNYSLIDQMRRSSGSMMDNIAEGFERGSTKEFICFLAYAKGSAGEQRSQIHRAHDLGYISNEDYSRFLPMLIAISGRLNKMIQYLSNVEHRGNRYK